MRFFMVFLIIIMASGCFTDSDPVIDSKNRWCVDGDADLVKIKDRFTIPNVIPVGEIKLRVDSSCLDPVSKIDPYTNPYRNSDGMNMLFCLPFGGDCGERPNSYMTVFKEDTKISLRNWLNIARSKEFRNSQSGVDVYQKISSKNDGKAGNQTYYVDNEERYVVSCVRENTDKQRCLFVAADNKFPFSYYLTVHGDPGVKWEDVYRKMSRFFNEAAVSQ